MMYFGRCLIVAVTRQDWRNEFSTNLQQKLQDMKTPPSLIPILHTDLITRISPGSQYNQFYQLLPFAGLLPIKWKQHPDHDHDPPDMSKTYKWAKTFSRWLTHQGFAVWKIRNSTIHEGKYPNDTTHQSLNKKISQLYNMQQDLPSCDRDIFQTPQEDRFEMTLAQKRQWIEQTTTTVKISIEDQRHKIQHGQHDIRKFFPPKATN